MRFQARVLVRGANRWSSTSSASNTSKLLRAIQAGREIRVILNAKNADDTATFQIAEAIVKRIEAEMTFSGEIKVTLLRETRAEAIVR
jgi:HD superfamily phosphodiesterase